MTSWKCAQCGLVNLAADTVCKRCGAAPAHAEVIAPPQPVGIVLEDGYVMPPPPAGGVWRDNSTLVMTKEAPLPDRCVRCNAPANGVRLKRRLMWHHPVLYLLIFIAFLLYVILATVLRKRATVYLGLCAEHLERRRKKVIAGWILLATGLLSTVAGFAYDYPGVGLLGFATFLVAVIWLVIVSRVVTVKKIDDQLVWLNGINSAYLSQLPPWQGQV